MFTMNSYFSVQYLAVLLPVTVVLYAVMPPKARRVVLLLASYAFFWAVSGKLLVYLLASTLSIHLFGLWLSHMQGKGDRYVKSLPKEARKEAKAKQLKKQRAVLALAVVLHVGILLTLKYSPFFITNVNGLFQFFQSPFRLNVPAFLLPIGISFYTLQAVSYLFDVYRRKIPADRNLLRLALFMGFFPQIMEGPICRYADTAARLWEAPPISWRNLTFGLQRMLFGIMKKMVVADRLNILIQNVFGNYQTYDGFVTAVAVVCYTVQLYMDFSGTMDLVIGSAQIFGVKLPENFQRPFFSRTISEFWKRWHITLGTWFKDYIFYPLSMSKPLKKLTSHARKHLGNHFGPLISGSIALLCVWVCNGLWHGAGWHYLFFGMYHFVLILCGSMVEPLVIKVTGALHIRRDSAPYRVMQIVRTGLLVCIGELFFRAEGLRAGLIMFRKMFTDFRFTAFSDNSIFTIGMDKHDFLIVFLVMVLIFLISLQQEKGIVLREKIAARPIAVRFAVYYLLILLIVIFGAYGAGYVPVDPIYAGF